jgi:hypothetical protein
VFAEAFEELTRSAQRKGCIGINFRNEDTHMFRKAMAILISTAFGISLATATENPRKPSSTVQAFCS